MIINDLSVLFCQSFEDRSKVYAWCMHEGLDNVRGNKEQRTRNMEQRARNKEQGTKNKEQGAMNKEQGGKK